MGPVPSCGISDCAKYATKAATKERRGRGSTSCLTHSFLLQQTYRIGYRTRLLLALYSSKGSSKTFSPYSLLLLTTVRIMIRSKTRHAFSFAALLLISTASAFLQQLPPMVPFTPGETNVGSCGHSQWLLNGGSRLHPLPSQQRQIGGMRLRSPTKVTMSTSDENNDAYFDGKTTAVLVGGQSLLILASIAIAALVGTPKLALGPGFDLNWQSFSTSSHRFKIIYHRIPRGLWVTEALRMASNAILTLTAPEENYQPTGP